MPDEKQDSLLPIALIGVLIFLSMRQGGGRVDPVSPSGPATPSAEMLPRLSELRQLARRYPVSAVVVGPFYGAAANLTDQPQVTTVQQLIDAIRTASEIKVGANPELSMPGLGDAVDKLTGDVIGDESVPLDDARRKTLSQVLTAIWWSMENPD